MSKPKSSQVLHIAASLLCFTIGYMVTHAFMRAFLQSDSYLRYQIGPADVLRIIPAAMVLFICLFLFARILSTISRSSRIFVALFVNASTALLAITQQFGMEVIPMAIFGAVATVKALLESGAHHDES